MNISNRPILLLLLITFIAQHCYSQVVDHSYKSTVHTFNEAWNTGKVSLLDEVVHPEYLKLEGELELKGIEALKEYVLTYRASYVDVKITYIDEVYGDEKAAINFTIDVTPKDTGKKFISEGIGIFCFRDGKIVEDHLVPGLLSALKQQGYKIIEQE